MATLLTNKTEVSELLQIAIGVEDKDFDKYIEEAQKFDFKKLVREDFYFDLLANKDEEDWKKIIDGGEYDFNNRTYEFAGASAVIGYFAYARFYLNSSAVSTSFGIVVKNNPQSTPLSLEERKNVHYKKKEEANELMKEVVSFIERNIEKYPSWNENSSCNNSKRSGFNTRVIQ